MIDERKVKLMTQMASYEKNEGKKDIPMNAFQRGDYIRYNILKTIVAASIAFFTIFGLIILWNLNTLVSHFDTLDYTNVCAALLIGYICFLAFFIVITYQQSKKKYIQMSNRIRQYQDTLNTFSQYVQEEKIKEEDKKKGIDYDRKQITF